MAKILGTDLLGRNIRRIRLEHHLTQEDMVAKMQLLGSPLSRSTLSIIEMGKGNVYASDLVAMQKVFQVDYAEFFQDISPARQSKSEE